MFFVFCSTQHTLKRWATLAKNVHYWVFHTHFTFVNSLAGATQSRVCVCPVSPASMELGAVQRNQMDVLKGYLTSNSIKNTLFAETGRLEAKGLALSPALNLLCAFTSSTDFLLLFKN